MATSHLSLALVVSSSLGASALVNGPSLLRVRGGGLPHLVPAAPALLRVRGGGPSLSEWWSQDAQAVPNPALLDDALSTAAKIASMSQPIVHMAKECVKVADETSLAEGLRFERGIFYSSFATADQKIGMRAFMDKAAPDFKDE